MPLLLAVACTPARDLTPAPEPAPQNVIAAVPVAQTIDEARTLLHSGQHESFERGARALTVSPDEDTRGRAMAMLGLFYVDRERFEEATPLLSGAATMDSKVAPFLRLRLIEAYSRLGNHASALSTAAEIVSTAPGSSAAIVARLRLPALHAAVAAGVSPLQNGLKPVPTNGDTTATDAAFRDIASIAIDELSESDFRDLASRLARSGRSDLANSIRMRLLIDYTSGRYTEATYGELVSDVTSPIHNLPESDAIELASRLARANRFDQALDSLERTGRRFTGGAPSEAYRTTRLRALFQSRHYADLLAEPANAKLDDPSLLLLRARAAWRDDRAQEFLTGLSALEKKFPSSKEAIEAKVQRAKYYVTDEPDYQKSISNLKAAIDAGALGNEGENLWTLGFTFVLGEMYDDALKTFDKYIAAYPDGDYKTNSLFWAAKVYERRHDPAGRDAKLRQLIAEYPFSYYAYRSKEIMGVDPLSASPIAATTPFPDIEGEIAAVDDPRLASVRALMKIDLYRDATREMKLVAADHPQNLGLAFMLADLYVEGGEPYRANTLLQRRFRQFVRHGGSNITPRFWRILFPLNYFDTIRKEASRQQLDAYLLASIIRQESGFEPTVVSSAGAVGLMQIMPAEISSIAPQAGLGDVTREKLFEPEANIAMGAAEYARKLAAMRGDHILAVAAYNAGEKAVGRWLARTPREDVDLFVESIPYAETRLYVKSVNRNRYEYRRIYESSSAEQQTQ